LCHAALFVLKELLEIMSEGRKRGIGLEREKREFFKLLVLERESVEKNEVCEPQNT